MLHPFKVFCILCTCLLFACKTDKGFPVQNATILNGEDVVLSNKQFNDYWYAGTAEISSYSLKQAQYGEIHEGEVVLIFVTEPFSVKKQVKLDHPNEAGNDNVSVMKLNQLRKFVTGIYDYSIINTTFTPINATNYPNTLKANTSIQEWCGHTFSQLNLKGKNYHFQQHSYFESEGDTERDLPVAVLEDELMTRIRLNKGELPLGEIDLILSTLYTRFTHNQLAVATAAISKTETDTTSKYKIDYLDYQRTVTIDVEKEFPYRILSWTEDNGKGLITTAELMKSIQEPYWSQKEKIDEAKRKTLQLR